MLTRLQCFVITVTTGEGEEAASSNYYVMAENAVQALAIAREKGIELGTNFSLIILKEVAGFVAPEVKESTETPSEGAKDTDDSAESKIELGTVGAVKMHAGHYMLFTVKEEKDILRNVTPDVTEVISIWSENSALIF